MIVSWVLTYDACAGTRKGRIAHATVRAAAKWFDDGPPCTQRASTFLDEGQQDKPTTVDPRGISAKPSFMRLRKTDFLGYHVRGAISSEACSSSYNQVKLGS